MDRINRDNYFMSIALVVSLRSTCLRAKVGAILVSNNRILATGYNGSPRGFPHCTQATCGDHVDHCEATVHAEINAIIAAAATGVSTSGSTLYTTHSPCADCARTLVNAGIREVRIHHMYGMERGLTILAEAGIQTYGCGTAPIFSEEGLSLFGWKDPIFR